MTTTTCKPMTPTTGPGANGRYRTKIERSVALLRDEGASISYPDFRHKYHVRYGDVLGAHDTTFYRARNQVKAERFKAETVAIEAREQSVPNVAERPTSEQSSDESASDFARAYGFKGVASETEPPKARAPHLIDNLIMDVRSPILSIAQSMGGLLALRRAVDELIGGLAPELREGVMP